MKKDLKKLTMLAFVLVLLPTTLAAVLTKPVVSGDTIYIRSDGAIDPATAPIQRNQDVYTLLRAIYAPIVVERDHVVVDGNGQAIHGADTGIGIDLSDRKNVTIRNVDITGFLIGVRLENSSMCSISQNHISFCTEWAGIYLHNSPNNSIWQNTIENTWDGVHLEESSYNRIAENTITNNENGIRVAWLSDDNSIHGNTITRNNNYGIGLFWYAISSSNTIISGNTITNNDYGVTISLSASNTICGNTITNNDVGLVLRGSSYNTIAENTLTNNQSGMNLDHYVTRYGEYVQSHSNTLTENNIPTDA